MARASRQAEASICLPVRARLPIGRVLLLIGWLQCAQPIEYGRDDLIFHKWELGNEKVRRDHFLRTHTPPTAPVTLVLDATTPDSLANINTPLFSKAMHARSVPAEIWIVKHENDKGGQDDNDSLSDEFTGHHAKALASLQEYLESRGVEMHTITIPADESYSLVEYLPYHARTRYVLLVSKTSVMAQIPPIDVLVGAMERAWDRAILVRRDDGGRACSRVGIFKDNRQHTHIKESRPSSTLTAVRLCSDDLIGDDSDGSAVGRDWASPTGTVAWRFLRREHLHHAIGHDLSMSDDWGFETKAAEYGSIRTFLICDQTDKETLPQDTSSHLPPALDVLMRDCKQVRTDPISKLFLNLYNPRIQHGSVGASEAFFTDSVLDQQSCVRRGRACVLLPESVSESQNWIEGVSALLADLLELFSRLCPLGYEIANVVPETFRGIVQDAWELYLSSGACAHDRETKS